MTQSIPEKAKKIKLIAMDVDGVLTGGEIIVLDSGEEVKIWDVKDRFAFHLAKTSDPSIRFAWITGRKSKQVELRAKEIGIHELYQGCMNKKDAMLEILKKYNLNPDEAAYIGDDIVDIQVLKYVGLSACPSDAPDDVKKEVMYVTKVPGGKGCLRELADMVLKSKGIWESAVRKYYSG